MICIRDLLGVPFKAHGRSSDGFDCWGLAIEVICRYGRSLPDVAYSDTSYSCNRNTAPLLMSELDRLFVNIDTPEEGCLIKFALDGKNITHAGVYLGHGEFIHCIEDYGVCVQRISDYKPYIKGYYRVLG